MIDLSTEDLRLMLEAGYLYLAMHRNKEAKEVFEGVCVLAPESDVPLVALGNAFFIEKKYDVESLKQNGKEFFQLGNNLFINSNDNNIILIGYCLNKL